MSRAPARLAALLLVAAAALTSCGGSSSGGKSAAPIVAPNIKALLLLPVATPSVCPPTENSTTVGRASPWEFTDLSIFLTLDSTTKDQLVLTRELRSSKYVSGIYIESKVQAYEEFQRLYTCSAAVPRSATPASFRVTLTTVTTIAERNALVAHLLTLGGVDTISCPAVESCVSVVQSARPSG